MFKGGLEDSMRAFSILISVISFFYKFIFGLVFYLHIVKTKEKFISGRNRVLDEEANLVIEMD